MALPKIGSFEVLAEIAGGNCGTIYKGLEPVNQRTVALRRIVLNHSPNDTRLQNSLRSAISLDSPNILRTQDVFVEDDAVIVVMEFVEGRYLNNVFALEKSFTLMELVDFSRQICSALDHAHSRGAVHQNLHMGNIVQEWDGNLKLMDYGLPLDVQQRTRMTPVSDSLRYLSPEQVLGAEVERRSNLFSWGAIIYEAALGKKAFDGDTAEAILKNIEAGNFVAPEDINRKLHPGLCAFMRKALAIKPEDRFQTGAELIYELEHCTKPLHAKAVDAPKVEKAPEIQVRRASKSLEWSDAPAVQASAPVAAPPPAPVPISPSLAEIAAKAAPVTIGVKQAAQPPVPVESHPPVATLVSPDPVSVPQASAPAPDTPKPDFFVIESKAKVTPTSQAAGGATQPASQPKPKAAPKKPLGPQVLSVLSSKQFVIGVIALAVIGVIALVASTFRYGKQERQASAEIQQSIAPESAQAQPETTAPAAPETQAVEPQSASTTAANNVVSSKPSRKDKQQKTAVPTTHSPMTGDLVIDSTPQGAAVQIDGRNMGLTPIAVSQLSPGQHNVALAMAGHAPVSRQVYVNAGERMTVALQLPDMQATVAILSSPSGASIRIDGRDTGRVTPATVLLSKGHHTITMSRAGFVDATSSFDAVPGQSLQVAPQLVALANADEVKEVGKLKKVFGGGSNTAGMTKIRIRTNPKGAQIELNNRRLGKTTPTEVYAPAGVYDITLSLSGYKNVHRRINVSGAEAVIDETLEP